MLITKSIVVILVLINKYKFAIEVLLALGLTFLCLDTELVSVFGMARDTAFWPSAASNFLPFTRLQP